MGKDKLRKFAEVKALSNVFEPNIQEALKGCERSQNCWNKDFFSNDQPITLELACGKGEYAVGMARKFPDRNFIGVDIKGARLWRGAKTATEEGLTNVNFLRTRIDFIPSFFGKDEVEHIWITFPDPQPKTNRRKKRLTHPLFLDRYLKFLKPGGRIHLKTDNPGFYNFSKAVAELNGFKIHFDMVDIYNGQLEDVDPELKEILEFKTYYETRWLTEGRTIYFLVFEPTQGKIEEPEEIEEFQLGSPGEH